MTIALVMDFPGGTREQYDHVMERMGLDCSAFREAHARIVPGGRPPEGLTWHINGPVEKGWCVIDGWISKEIRDRFLEATVQPGMAGAPLQGPPAFEDLPVEGELRAAAAAAAV